MGAVGSVGDVTLFRDYDDRTTEAMHAALATGGRSLDDVASIVSATYVDCCLSMGPEIGAIFDALSASEETQGFLQSWRAFLIDEFRKAFAPFVKLPRRRIDAILAGGLGAAKALSDAAAAGRFSRNEAVSALSAIMAGALAPGAVSSPQRR